MYAVFSPEKAETRKDTVWDSSLGGGNLIVWGSNVGDQRQFLDQKPKPVQMSPHIAPAPLKKNPFQDAIGSLRSLWLVGYCS